MTWGSFLWLSVNVTPFLAPISLFAFYPLQTLWVRMAYEAGNEVKHLESAYQAFEHIMDNEGGPKNLWNGFSVYAARNSVLVLLAIMLYSGKGK